MTMCVLGVESSCDETAAAIVRGGIDVLSNVIASQHDLHAPYAGVVPEIASRAHIERIVPVIRRALSEAGVTLDDIDAIAVGHRPGLIGSLLVGVSAAKALAWSLGKPLIGIDHVQAHLYAGLLRTRAESSTAKTSGTGVSPVTTQPLSSSSSSSTSTTTSSHLFPALGLVVSGGHTALYRLDSPLRVRRLGSTIDDAVGEAFDKAATILGLPHPGGPNLDALARRGDDRAFDFPISRLAPDSLDFSFSGLKTAVLYAVRGVPQEPPHAPGEPPAARSRPPRHAVARAPLDPARHADVAASFQRAAISAILLKLARAIDHANPAAPFRSLLVGGGVTANSRLRAELVLFARSRGLELRIPAMEYCLDNAAMIAGLAHHRLIAGDTDSMSLSAHPSSALS